MVHYIKKHLRDLIKSDELMTIWPESVVKMKQWFVMNYLVHLNYLVLPDEKRKLNNRDYWKPNPNHNHNPR